MGKYERIIFWSEEDQKWLVDVPELPGCMEYRCQGRLEKYYNTMPMKWAFKGSIVDCCNNSVAFKGEWKSLMVNLRQYKILMPKTVSKSTGDVLTDFVEYVDMKQCTG